MTVPPTDYGKIKSKLQPIFQVTFDFDANKKPFEIIVQMDEDYKRTLADFDLNYWDLSKYRNFKNCEEMVKIIPQ